MLSVVYMYNMYIKLIIQFNNISTYRLFSVLIDAEFYSQLKEYLKSGKISHDVPEKRRNLFVERAKNYKV